MIGGIARHAEGIAEELRQRLPAQRKTQRGKLALLVATMLHARTANLMALAASLPLATERADMRYQWIARFIDNEHVVCDAVMESFAREVLARAAEAGRVTLIMDQTKASDRHQILMLSLRFAERALPLAWRVEATDGAIGFGCQKALLAAITPWLPPDADICLMADRFYGTPELIGFATRQGWDYRLRLKGNLSVFIDGHKSRLDQHVAGKLPYLRDVQLTHRRVATNIGIINDPGHDEPWFCHRRMNSPQKWASGIPHFVALGSRSGASSGSRTRRGHRDCPPVRREGFGGSTWEIDDDPGLAPAGAQPDRHRAPARRRPQDGAQIHRPRHGAAELPHAAPAAALHRCLPALSRRAAGGLSGPECRPADARAARARLRRRLHRGQRAIQEMRPPPERRFEVRFETPPGEQAQVDFARFEVTFTDEPGITRIVWLFSMVLGFSRLIWGRFVIHQDLQSVLRCHVAAFAAIGGAPREILYDRMKTAVIGEDADGLVAYNRSLVDLARHFGFQPKACRPYRAKTKGKVERPFRYIREDFYLARSFRNLDDLNAQLRQWLDTVANPRTHATTRRVVNEAFAEERTALRPLPLAPYRAVLKLERRVSHEGMVSVGGNAYSVPDTARRRVLDVHCLVDEVQIFEDGVLIARHAALPGRGQSCIDPTHRKALQRSRRGAGDPAVVVRGAGDVVARRSLDFYDARGRVMAVKGRA